MRSDDSLREAQYQFDHVFPEETSQEEALACMFGGFPINPFWVVQNGINPQDPMPKVSGFPCCGWCRTLAFIADYTARTKVAPLGPS